MRSKILYLALLGSLILTICGCASMFNKSEKVNPNAPLKPQVILKFEDVPVPLNFKLQTQSSYYFESSGLRVAVLKYKGIASLEGIVNFYKEQMPMHNWNLLNITEYGNCMMNFDREEEICVITISSKGNNSIINISLGPKSKGVSKKSKQAIK